MSNWTWTPETDGTQTVTVTATTPRGVVTTVSVAAPVAPAPAAPTLSTEPEILGAVVVGSTIDAQPGVWDHADAVATEVLVNGVAVALPYAVQPADDGASVVLRETATGPGGESVFTASAQSVVYPAPTLDALADVSAAVGDASLTVQATGSGLTGGAWSVEGPGASVDQAGLVTISTTEAALGTVAVTYANSGGQAFVSFGVTISGAGSGAWSVEDIGNLMLFEATSETLTLGAGDVVDEWRSSVNTFSGGATIALSPANANKPVFDAANGAIHWSNTANTPHVLRGALPALVSDQTGITVLAAFEHVGTGTPDQLGTLVHFAASSAAWSTTRYTFATNNPFGAGGVGIADEPRLTLKNAGVYIYGGELYDASGVKRVAWIDGREAVPEGAGQGAPAAEAFAIGGKADATTGSGQDALRSCRLAAIAIIGGVISKEDRQKLEGWMRETYGLVQSIALTDEDGTSPHPWALGAPTGGAPEQVNAIPAQSAYEGLRIEDIDLRDYILAATLYTVDATSDALPTGVDLTDGVLRGTPGTAGTFNIVIRAANAQGHILVPVTLTVAAVPATATDDIQILAAAFNAPAGTSITLDVDALAPRTTKLPRLGGLTGSLPAKVIGAVDFVAVGQAAADAATDPALPASVVYAGHEPVAFTDRTLSPVAKAAAPAHPIYTATWRDNRGPASGLPVPFDFAGRGAGAEALGLRVNGGNVNDAESWRNGVAFDGSQDGHVVWLAEYGDALGGIVRFWTEAVSAAKGLPFWPSEETVRGAGAKALHLRRLVQLQVADMASLRVGALVGTDPRLWTAPAKLERHALPAADFTAPFTTAAGTWAAVDAHIAGLSVSNGVISGKTAGQPYIIQLPAGRLEQSATEWRLALSSGAKATLGAATSTRVMLVGVPGETVIEGVRLQGSAQNLDMAFLTIGRPGATHGGGEYPNNDGQIRIESGSHVRMFGVTAIMPDGRATAPIYLNEGSKVEFYDGVISGYYSAFQLAAGGHMDPEKANRAFIARSLIDVSNDVFEGYSAGLVQLSSNYVYGTGGALNNTGYTWLHRDYAGQINQVRSREGNSAGGVFRYALYDNIFESGPNAHDVLANRGLSEQMMLQNGRISLDVVGNVLQTETPTSGVGTISSQTPVPWDTPRLGVVESGAHQGTLAWPTLTGTRAIGETITAVPGAWARAEGGVVTTLTVGGVARPSPYTLQSGDDVNDIVVRDVATSAEGQTAWAEATYTASGVKYTQQEYLGWIENSVIAGNLYTARPERMVRAGVYPERRGGDVLSGLPSNLNPRASSTLLHAGNLIDADPDLATLSLFDRALALIPEARRAGWIDTRDFASWPVLTQTGTIAAFGAEVTADWSATTYAGTGREGYLDPADLTPGAALATYSGGKGPGWSADGLIGLAADWTTHIGYVDSVGSPLASGLPADAFGKWTPAPFSPSSTIADPWAGGGDDRKLLLNMQIATRGAGTIAEEIAADGSGWRFELLPTTFRPRWTMFGPTAAGNPVLAQATDRHEARSGDHLLFAANLDWVTVAVEWPDVCAQANQVIWDRRRAQGVTTPLAIRVTAAGTAPTADMTGVAKHVWLDQSAGGRNLAHDWNGSAWVALDGWLSEWISLWQYGYYDRVTRAAGQTPVVGNYDKAPIPLGTRTLHFVESLDDVTASALPNEDWVFAVYLGAPTPSPSYQLRMVNDAQVGGYDANLNPPIRQRQRGHVDMRFRVAGRHDWTMPDWVWPNTRVVDENGVNGVYTLGSIPKGSLRLGAATASPATGLQLGYFEARRQRVSVGHADFNMPNVNWPGVIPSITTTEHIFARAPVDTATGDRGMFWGVPPVWVAA